MKHLVWITAIVLATLVGVYVLWQLRAVILLFLLSLGCAAAVRPLVDYMCRGGARRSIALVLTYVAVLGSLLTLAIIAAGPLLSESQQFVDDSIGAYEELSRQWQHGSRWQKWLAVRLPDPEHAYDEILLGRGADALWSMLGMTLTFFGAIVNMIVIVVLSLYWSLDRVHFERLWLSLLPVGSRIEARSLWRAIEEEAGGYLRSELIQSLLAGIVLALGLRLLDYPYPTLLATVAALCWLIPWLGMLLAVLAAALITWPVLVLEGATSGLIAMGAAAALTLMALLALEIWVEPRLFQRRRFNSLLIVLVVVALADVFGVVGLVVGPPVAAAIQIFTGHLVRYRLTAQTTANLRAAPSIRDRLSAVQGALAGTQEPPLGLVNLVHRLSQLVEQLGELPQIEPSEAAPVGYANAAGGAAPVEPAR